MISFSIKWHRKRAAAFSYLLLQLLLRLQRLVAGLRRASGGWEKTHPFFFGCFPYVCPEPVLVKVLVLKDKNGAKIAFSYLV
jgi:hypothetical protein